MASTFPDLPPHLANGNTSLLRFSSMLTMALGGLVDYFAPSEEFPESLSPTWRAIHERLVTRHEELVLAQGSVMLLEKVAEKYGQEMGLECVVEGKPSTYAAALREGHFEPFTDPACKVQFLRELNMQAISQVLRDDPEAMQVTINNFQEVLKAHDVHANLPPALRKAMDRTVVDLYKYLKEGGQLSDLSLREMGEDTINRAGVSEGDLMKLVNNNSIMDTVSSFHETVQKGKK